MYFFSLFATSDSEKSKFDGPIDIEQNLESQIVHWNQWELLMERGNHSMWQAHLLTPVGGPVTTEGWCWCFVDALPSITHVSAGCWLCSWWWSLGWRGRLGCWAHAIIKAPISRFSAMEMLTPHIQARFQFQHLSCAYINLPWSFDLIQCCPFGALNCTVQCCCLHCWTPALLHLKSHRVWFVRQEIFYFYFYLFFYLFFSQW